MYTVYLCSKEGYPQYVGCTTNPEDRKRKHFRGTANRNSGCKYDDFQVLAEVKSEAEAKRLESEYIERFNTYVNGDNKTRDGQGCAGLKGKDHLNYGRKWSDETRKKMSESSSGEKNPNYGKPRSEEEKRKISEATKGEKNSAYRKPAHNRGEVWEHAHEIVEKRESGMSQQEVADLFGCSRSAVRRILKASQTNFVYCKKRYDL